jgi:hypothetical protein
MRMKRLLVIVPAIVVVLAVAAWIATRDWNLATETHLPNPQAKLQASGIIRVQLIPVPEGPLVPTFELHPSHPYARPLSEIAGYIPVLLPTPLVQAPACRYGGDLKVTIEDGHSITYGPCSRPDSINHLWAGIMDLLDHGSCEPKCGPGDMPGP